MSFAPAAFLRSARRMRAGAGTAHPGWHPDKLE